MKISQRLLAGAGAAAALAALAALALWARPPQLIRIAANYTAKIICSNVFLAGRDPAEILRTDVQAPGNPLLRLMRVSVDRDRRMVRAGLFGFIGSGLAIERAGAGCAVLPDGRLEAAVLVGADSASAPAGEPLPVGLPWPDGDAVRTDPALERVIADQRLAGPGMRAIIVVARGRLVAERYGAGFSANTPLLGWSMTKSVVAGLIGILVEDGRLSLQQSAGWPAGGIDGRAAIRIADLLSMTSGLRFNEAYGDVSDVTRMLYMEPDMAAYARAQPLDHRIGSVWSYSSGTAMILSRIFQDAAGPGALDYVREHLFAPLGMRSATLETDEHGTLVGSSYLYATARDWARYAQLLMQDGRWQGRQILPAGYVAMMADPVAPSAGQYGHGMVWRFGSDARIGAVNPDRAFGIPADTFWMEGHDGQSIALIPSRGILVLRMGLTPESLRYRPQPLVRAVLAQAGS